jgi:hypothetical protein
MELVVGKNDRIHQVCCKVCINIEEMEKLVVSKVGYLQWKHVGRRTRAKGHGVVVGNIL